jgi:hypothetical protein
MEVLEVLHKLNDLLLQGKSAEIKGYYQLRMKT